MPLCSELMSRPKKAVAGYRPERTTPGGPSRAGRGRQYCKLRWLLSPKPEFSKCIFELKMPRPVIWQRFTSTNSCHEPPLPYGVVGCRRGPSSIASEVAFTKAASDSNGHNVGRAHSSPYLGSGFLERFRGVARWRIRTGPRRKSSEQRRRLSSSGCRRQLFEPTC